MPHSVVTYEKIIQIHKCNKTRRYTYLSFVVVVEVVVIFRLIRIQWLVYPLTLSFIPDWCYVISQNTYVTLDNSFSNIIIPSQRLVTMSVSLHIQTVLCCLIIQVLNTRVWFLNDSLTSVHSNLEHGLAILTESFSPLRSVLHNLSCWSPKQKCTLSYAIPFYTMYT